MSLHASLTNLPDLLSRRHKAGPPGHRWERLKGELERHLRGPQREASSSAGILLRSLARRRGAEAQPIASTTTGRREPVLPDHVAMEGPRDTGPSRDSEPGARHQQVVDSYPSRGVSALPAFEIMLRVQPLTSGVLPAYHAGFRSSE